MPNRDRTGLEMEHAPDFCKASEKFNRENRLVSGWERSRAEKVTWLSTSF